MSSLTLSTLTVTSNLNTSNVSMSSGLLKLSARGVITSGSPYVINFFGSDGYVILPVNSSSPFAMTVPSGSSGQLLIIINQGSGTLNLTINIDGVSGLVAVSSGSKLFLVWLSLTWLSIA